MQLDEILEDHSVKTISQKTKIAEKCILELHHKEFDKLDKVRTLGFISIIEREFGVKLNQLREDAEHYYQDQKPKEERITVGRPIHKEKNGTPKWFLMIVLFLLVIVLWFFFNDINKEKITKMIPFQGSEESVAADEVEIAPKDLDIVPLIEQTWENNAASTVTESETPVTVEEPVAVVEIEVPEERVASEENTSAPDEDGSLELQTEEAEEKVVLEEQYIEVIETKPAESVLTLRPKSRIWFGIVYPATGERDNFTASELYTFDLSKGDVLLATSGASFFLAENGEERTYNDGKAHHFQLNKSGIREVTKSEYVTLGGYRRW